MKMQKATLDFPEFASPYAVRLAKRSEKFALQVYDSHLTNAPVKFGADPFGELSTASKCYGLKQRFKDRVLIMTADKCFMNCRHCTRRGLLGGAEVVRSKEQLDACVDYVKQNLEIRDILLSGGDVLTLSDKEVSRFVNAFARLKQIEMIRICTRALCANPARITDSLVKILSRPGKVWVNTQFNCVDELTPAARKAAAKLVDAGVPVSCQTVLLKEINDTPEEMLSLLRALSAARIRPYYVFMCDPVAGTEGFHVPLSRAKEIEKYCAESIGGLAMPRFVRDVPGAKRKMPI
jgi:lysine 2,3-aminomutase